MPGAVAQAACQQSDCGDTMRRLTLTHALEIPRGRTPGGRTGEVHPESHRCCAAAQKSVKVFFFVRYLPGGRRDGRSASSDEIKRQ